MKGISCHGKCPPIPAQTARPTCTWALWGLGYMGVDLVVDANEDLLLLELNASPGLAIQMASFWGLLPRLRAIEGLRRPHFTPSERAKHAMNVFTSL